MQYKVVDMKVDGYTYDDFVPSLACYIPDIIEMKPAYKKPSVIVCPGGGYEVLWETEREAVALKYLAEGFNTFVLNYSVIPAQYPTQLLELAKAVSYVREHAEEFDADPDRIILCGFSAGGHLAANLGACWNKDYFKDITQEGSNHKPNGVILAYPVITVEDDDLIYFYNRFIGENPSEALKDKVSLERQVDSDTVPTFMWGTYDDPLVKHILVYGLALHQHKIPFESLIYQRGPHGIALANDVTSFKDEQNIRHCADWFDKSVEWIKQL